MKEKSAQITILALRLLTCLSLLSGAIAASWAQDFTATLRGVYEVPPNSSTVSGAGKFTLSGNVLCSMIYLSYGPGGDPRFDCCTWPSVGIWGPAPPSSNGPFVLELTYFGAEAPPPGPPPPPPDWLPVLYWSCDELNDQQVEALHEGLLYMNVISPTYPAGEVRGQICPLTSGAD